MHYSRLTTFGLFGAALFAAIAAGAQSPGEENPAKEPTTAAISATDAAQRAQLLHETIHATLQAVHHDYYREDEGLTIPAASLKKVFRELETRQRIQLRWLAIDAQAMNTDHQPKTEFERQAVKALASGQNEFEQTENGLYRRAGSITLTSDCLKCHAPTRMSNKDRKAGLVIAIPLKAATKPGQ